LILGLSRFLTPNRLERLCRPQTIEAREARRALRRKTLKGGTIVQSLMLQPVIVLVLWSFVMWAWLYATRIRAVLKYKVVMNPHQPTSEFHAQLPAEVRWKADNYNNLMEQPTLFYAVAITLAILGEASATNLTLAWLYVGLRVVHSFVQATTNVIIVRFSVFMIASVVLLLLAIRAALTVF
jgi:hypothetical protein